MDINEFINEIVDMKSVRIRIDGKCEKSLISGKDYVHYEVVLFSGKDRQESTYQILYHTTHNFTLLYKDHCIDITPRKLRTYIAPTYTKSYKKSDVSESNSRLRDTLNAAFQDTDLHEVTVAEYGLNPGKDYFVVVKTERYYLPPQRPGRRPVEKTKRLIRISDSPLPNKIPLTPYYRNWSY